MPVGQQATRSYGKLIFERDGVERFPVHLVELDLARHALLLDEHGEADRRRVRTRVFPGQEIDFQHRAKSIIAA